MEKVTYSFDKDAGTFYIFYGKINKSTININLDEDVVLRFDLQKRRAAGFTISNFDVRYPKLLKLIGTKNDDLLVDYFDMFLKDINNLVMPIITNPKERKIFKDLINDKIVA